MKALYRIIVVVSLLAIPQTVLALRAVGYMGAQFAITQIQDKLESQQSIPNTINPFTIHTHQSGIQNGPNLGVMAGGMLIWQNYTFGAELRLSHLEYNHTRIFSFQRNDLLQGYKTTHTSKMNNLSQVLLKPGVLLLGDSMLYGNLGLGILSTKLDVEQLLNTNFASGIYSKKTPGLVLGLGLEFLIKSNFSLYSDFNYTYLLTNTHTETQAMNGVRFNFEDELKQQIFQAVFGIKWHHRKSPRYTAQGLCGWYVGTSLGLMQSNLNLERNESTSPNFSYYAMNRLNKVSPDLEIKIGNTLLASRWVLILEATAALHPLRQTDHLKTQYTTNTTDNRLIDSQMKNNYSFTATIKPGMSFYKNRLAFLILGIGTSQVKVDDHSLSWPTLFVTGWGLESRLHDKLNIRAEYTLQYASNLDTIQKNSLSQEHNKLVQNKGSLGLIYYL